MKLRFRLIVSAGVLLSGLCAAEVYLQPERGTARAQAAAPAGSQLVQAVEVYIEPRFDSLPADAYQMKQPPKLSAADLARIERALQKSHGPMPPLPVEPGIDASRIQPNSPATDALMPDAGGPKPASGPPPAPVSGTAALEPPGPQAAGDFRFFRVTDVTPATAGSTSFVDEPSVSQVGQTVFYTGNWFGALSTDGGRTFTFVNPFTGPFPPVNAGFCCDQSVVADPSRNVIFWEQQYINDGNTATQRINVDRNADGTWDCDYDFTPQNLGLPAGRQFDFPDLVVGANSLYHSSNIFNQTSPFATEAMISRYPLNEMSNCQGFGYQAIVRNDNFSLRATHGTGSTVYIGSHNSTSQIRIFNWTEGSGTYFFDDRNINAWSAGVGVCPGPDGKDWCGFADSRIQGAYLANGVIGFMWNASQGGGFAYPQVQVAQFRESDRAFLSQAQIWNPSYAWQYPSVGVNGRGHLGGTIAVGGGSIRAATRGSPTTPTAA